VGKIAETLKAKGISQVSVKVKTHSSTRCFAWGAPPRRSVMPAAMSCVLTRHDVAPRDLAQVEMDLPRTTLVDRINQLDPIMVFIALGASSGVKKAVYGELRCVCGARAQRVPRHMTGTQRQSVHRCTRRGLCTPNKGPPAVKGATSG
jgi:hypothetical protein